MFRKETKHHKKTNRKHGNADLELEEIVPKGPSPKKSAPIPASCLRRVDSELDLTQYIKSEKCSCCILQPEPTLPHSPPKVDRVLLGSAKEYDICICRSADNIYRLIATHKDTDELFLNITLNYAKYVIKSELWHEIESSQCGRKKTIVLNFKYRHDKRKEESFRKFFNELLNILHNQQNLARVAVFYPPGYNADALLANDVTSIKPELTIETNLPKEPGMIDGTENMALSPEDIQNYMIKLSQAIENGEVEEAKTMAATLARQKLKMHCEVLSPLGVNPEKDVSVKVCVEDKDSSGASITLKIRPSVTIDLLKKRIEREYGFPQAIQKWIIGQRMPRDKDTLKACGVKGPGHTLFLYLVSARSVGLTKEAFMQAQAASGHLPASNSDGDQGGYMSMDHFMRGTGAGPIPAGPHLPQPSMAAKRPVPPVPPKREVAPPLPTHPPPSLSQASRQETARTVQVLSEMSISDTKAAAKALIGVTPGSASAGTAGRSKGRAQGVAQSSDMQGWTCPKCTYINIPTRPGCEICAESRPADYCVPENFAIPQEEQNRLEREHQLDLQAQDAQRHQEEIQRESSQRNYQALLAVDDQDFITNRERFECPICFDVISPGEGIILRECLHSFCKQCLSAAVQFTEEAALKCPYQDDEYSCPALLQEREIRALVERDIFERYLQRSIQTAESQAPNSYHCKTTDCTGWCIYEDFVNFFDCPVCKKQNCLTCKAIHEGMNCKQYQADLRIRAENDTAAKQTHVVLQGLLSSGEAMHCPTCQVIVQKKEGCDWVCCSICKTEICWVTKGPRWGPNGEGDISGGCRCRVNNERCHPDCTNCH